jgi:hypothetical protein
VTHEHSKLECSECSLHFGAGPVEIPDWRRQVDRGTQEQTADAILEVVEWCTMALLIDDTYGIFTVPLLWNTGLSCTEVSKNLKVGHLLGMVGGYLITIELQVVGELICCIS